MGVYNKKGSKKTEINFDGYRFDSQEELDFYYWCMEGVQYKLLDDFKYNSKEFELSKKAVYNKIVNLKTKTKTKECFLLHPCTYKPDFIITINDSFKSLFADVLLDLNNDGMIHIDIKGGYISNDASSKFSIIQKWVYDKFGIFVKKIIPSEFFTKTWCPELAYWVKDGKRPYKKYAKCSLIKDI